MSAERARRGARRAVGVLLGLVAGAAGCSRTGTNVLTHISLCGLPVASLDVSISKAGNVLATRSYEPVADGDTFDVRLPDALDGETLQVIGGAKDGRKVDLRRASVDVTVRKGQTVEATLSFCDGARPDMAVSDFAMPLVENKDLVMGPPDLAVPADLAAPADLATPDLLAPRDLLMPDLAGCRSTCLAGPPSMLANACCPAQPSPKCAGGCARDGLHCLVPGCGASPTPRAIPNGAPTMDDNGGAPDNTASSCGGAGGGEAVFKISVPDVSPQFGPPLYTNVVLTAQVGAPSALYTRRAACADGAGFELPIGGPCANTPQTTTCSSDGAKITQVLCGVEPGDYFAVVDGLGCAGGPITITPSLAAAVKLDDCTSAGMIPGPYPRTLVGGAYRTFGASGNHAAPQGTPDCGGTDLGGASPDLMFYVPLPQPAGRTITIDLRSSNAPQYAPLLIAGQAPPGTCKLSSVLCNDGSVPQGLSGPRLVINGNNLQPGPLFIIVDGLRGTSGAFSLTVDVK